VREMPRNLFEGFNWNMFRNLEDKVLDCNRFVHLHEKNFDIFSLEFVNLIFQICSNIEATFKGMLFSNHFNENDYFYRKVLCARRKVEKDKPLDIGVYRDIFEEYYSLSGCEVIIDPLGKALSYFPFLRFSKNEKPFWWDNYNTVKHNLANKFEEATLETVLISLAALFLLNVVHLDARSFLIENKVFKSYDAITLTPPSPYKVEELKKLYSEKQHFEIENDACIIFISRLFLFQVARCGERWNQHNTYWFHF
jgi:hypothetical protein